MAVNRRDLYIPYKHREPIAGRRVGTRLDHEHDMSDAFWNRLNDAEKFQAWKKSLKKKDERKWHHIMVNFFVWATLYAAFMILVLKYVVRVL